MTVLIEVKGFRLDLHYITLQKERCFSPELTETENADRHQLRRFLGAGISDTPCREHVSHV